MEIAEAPSPNHEPRPPETPVDILLLHYTGMASAEAALARLRDPAAKVSAHYMIGEDGRVLRLVPEDRRAWHAGRSCWAGATNINDRAIGIELVNPGHEFGYRPFPEAQMAALTVLAGDILARHRIPRARVLAHSDVAPERKADPGELFDWRRLADAGLAVWPAPAALPGETPAIAWFQGELAAAGYCLAATGELDTPTHAVLTAFQRRFRPEAVTGEPDRQTAARLAGLRLMLEREVRES